MLFALLALGCVAVYWPALHGGYIFDDSIYFVDNQDVHVTTLGFGDWWRAASSQCAMNLLCRPLSALTLAGNYYLSGLDPFWPKLTNVMIHVVNGAIVFLMLRALFAFNAQVRHQSKSHDIAAAVIAGTWLLLPINLTAVAYVSQRSEALATFFVFAGLWWYIRLRQRAYEGRQVNVLLWFSIGTCTLVGLTAKEDAALLPLLAACIEFAIPRFRNRDGRLNRSTIALHVCTLLLPLLLACVFIVPRAVSGISAFRNFSIGERVLTESRVLIDYIVWTLLPSLNSLTFYHDDLPVSHSLLDPATTLFSIVALGILLAAGFIARHSRPLLCLGILWFFAGQSMTATIIPLELVFEHRNYFPSVGLLLAVASVLFLEPVVKTAVLRIVPACFILFFGFVTFLRAEEWSNPIKLAYNEALKRPNSARAQYELARLLIIASNDNSKSPLIEQARDILKRNAANPESGISSLQALIYINAKAQQPIDPEWWKEIVDKLTQRTPTKTDIAAITFLAHCQFDGDCPQQTQELLDVFQVGLQRSNGDPNLMSAYADFAAIRLHDNELAERMYTGAIAAIPKLASYRINYIQFLLATRQFDKAQAAITELKQIDFAGAEARNTSRLEQMLQAARDSDGSTSDAKPQ